MANGRAFAYPHAVVYVCVCVCYAYTSHTHTQHTQTQSDKHFRMTPTDGRFSVVVVARLSSIANPSHPHPQPHTHTHTQRQWRRQHTDNLLRTPDVNGRQLYGKEQWGEHVNSVELQPDKRGVEVSNLKVMSVCVWSGAGPG